MFAKSAAKANRRVEARHAGSGAVIISERKGTHRGISAGINVVCERPPTNCRVVVGSAGVRGVIIQERLGTHGGVIKGISIKEKRLRANCRVVDGKPASEGVITRERQSANGSVITGENTGKKRAIAKSAVAGSVDVAEQRGIAKSVVVVGCTGSARVIIIEHKGADTIVEAANGVVDERVSSNGHVLVAGEVEDHRCGANCGIGIRIGPGPCSTGEGQRSSTNTGVEAAVTD